MDYLPEVERPWVRRKLRAAWANPNADEAEAALRALAAQLERVNPDAAASLREGLAETVTVTRLGVTGALLKTVMSTNPVESMIEIVRTHAHNVKRWQDGDMRLRWAAAGMLAASRAVPAREGLPPTPRPPRRPASRRRRRRPVHHRCHSLTVLSIRRPPRTSTANGSSSAWVSCSDAARSSRPTLSHGRPARWRRAKMAEMNDADAIDFALLVLRCGLGAVMVAHGYNHIWGGGKVSGTARWFGSMGMRAPRLQAWLASVTELAAGTSLILGLLTPLGAAGVMGVMVVAFVINHRGNGFFIFHPGEGWEYVMTLALTGIAVGALGAGEWSLDEVFGVRDDLLGWPGLLLATATGGGGAAVLLAAAWRPQPKTA